MAPSDRRQHFKSPNGGLSTPQLSQEARRAKALDDQKRRRAQRIDSARNLDLFAGLNLGPSDDEGDEHEHAREPMRTGIGPFASLLHSDVISDPSASVPPPTDSAAPDDADKMDDDTPSNFTKKKRRKKKARGGPPKPSKYAEKCMYAELLELRGDPEWSSGDGDGLPPDLEHAWVSVAPVPAGKRCLAVTFQSSGVAGVVPNTHLRSRLLGKSLLRPFPSALPENTILDCILDARWRETGILHILDVIKWKGQDVGDCETPFRFWFRDSRVSELPHTSPARQPPSYGASSSEEASNLYRFPYPCSFVPIPYDTDTTLSHLLTHTIPAARSTRSLSLALPAPTLHSSSLPPFPQTTNFTFSLPTPSATPTFGSHLTPAPTLTEVHVRPDGLLLYVAQAAYEPGTSPLSNWVPIGSGNDDAAATTVLAEEMAWDGSDVGSRAGSVGVLAHEEEGRLAMFERLVQRRLASGSRSSPQLVQDDAMMDV